MAKRRVRDRKPRRANPEPKPRPTQRAGRHVERNSPPRVSGPVRHRARRRIPNRGVTGGVYVKQTSARRSGGGVLSSIRKAASTIIPQQLPEDDPRRPVATSSGGLSGTGTIRVVTCSEADTPYQGPDVPLPPGFACVVYQRASGRTPTGYVGFSESDVQNDRTRAELTDGGWRSWEIDNMNRVWVMSDIAGTQFEFTSEV